METNLSVREKFKVSSADTEIYGRLRLSSLVNMLIQSAIISADSLGFGFGGLREQHLFWVLSRLTLEILKPAKWKDEIEIETWPKKVEKIVYIRDFHVRGSSGEIIARATSGWFAIDLQTKQPKSVEFHNAYSLSILRDKNAIEEMPLKIVPAVTKKSTDIITSYFDYDINGHVTSSRYIDWMMDRIGIDFHKKSYPKKLLMNYLKETMPGESVRLSESELHVNEFYFEGLNLNSEVPAFRGMLLF